MPFGNATCSLRGMDVTFSFYSPVLIEVPVTVEFSFFMERKLQPIKV